MVTGLKQKVHQKSRHGSETICWELHQYGGSNHNEIIGMELNVGFLPKSKKSSICRHQLAWVWAACVPSDTASTKWTDQALLCPGEVWPVPICCLGGQGGPLVATQFQDRRGCQMYLGMKHPDTYLTRGWHSPDLISGVWKDLNGETKSWISARGSCCFSRSPLVHSLLYWYFWRKNTP